MGDDTQTRYPDFASLRQRHNLTHLPLFTLADN